MKPAVAVTFELKMPSAWRLHHVTVVRTHVLEELIALIIRVTRAGEVGTMLAVTSKRSTLVTAVVISSLPIRLILMMEVIHSSEAWVLTGATLRNILEDDILHSHRRENLKFYIALTGGPL
jgi:hypothetical protein